MYLLNAQSSHCIYALLRRQDEGEVIGKSFLGLRREQSSFYRRL
jgi:hypothetical protein